jgi:hypothetical protein
MSSNIHQIYLANPITTNASTDLMYFGQSPYTTGDDAAMTYANFSAQFLLANVAAPIEYTMGQLLLSYDATNLKLSGSALNTIQDIDTGASPTFLDLNLSSLAVSEAVVTDASKNLISYPYSAVPFSDSSIASRDAHGNSAFNDVVVGTTSTVSNGGTINLSIASSQIQNLTGTENETYTLPQATTLSDGWQYTFNNQSTGNMIIQYFDTTAFLTLSSGQILQIYLVNNGTNDGTWNYGWLMPENANYNTAGMTVTGTLEVTSTSNLEGAVTFGNNPNLQGLSNVNTALLGPIFQTGLSGGVQTYALPVGIVESGTTFNNVTNDVSFGNQYDFSSSSPKTITLEASGIANTVGFYFIVTNSGSGAITFSPFAGNTIYGPTTLAGGSGAASTPMAIVSVINIGNSTVWYINIVNAFNLMAGTNISISSAAGGTTINSTATPALTYSVVTGTSQTLAVNNGYFANNSGLVTFTLPTTFAVGSVFEVRGLNSGGWKISQNAGQQIISGNQATTVGTGGSLASANQYDVIRMVAAVANTTLTCDAPQGNQTVT